MRKNSVAKIAFTETDMCVISAIKKYIKNFTKGRKKQMAKQISETQKRVKIIEKLISLGVTDEEKIKKLTPADLIKTENIGFSEIMLIYELQECVKTNKVFSFLAKGE